LFVFADAKIKEKIQRQRFVFKKYTLLAVVALDLFHVIGAFALLWLLNVT
jgi:hypothetical protein